jgi:hypothetical protein
MKIINKLFFVIAPLTAGAILSSCEKSFDDKTPGQTNFQNSAIAQVYVATVNASRNYLYMDGNQVTGSLMGSGSLFPSGANGFSVNSGLHSLLIRDTATATTQVPYSFSQNFAGGNRYTIFVYDTITAPKQKTVVTNIVIPSDTSSRIRFANFVHSNNALPAVDLFSTRNNRNLFTNVSVTDVTDFVPIPSGLTDTLYVRLTGTGTNLMNITPPTPLPGNVLVSIGGILTPTAKRSYTIVFRGSYATILTNAAQVRTLSAFINY